MYKLMIVEDEMFVRVGLENIVNWADYQLELVPSASNGKEALQHYEQYHPNLIITDIKMPEMDGLQLISQIRKEDKTVKFIVLTCLEDYQTAKQALNLSVSHYCNKSDLDIEELKRYVDELMQEIARENVEAKQTHSADSAEKDKRQWEDFLFCKKDCDLTELLRQYEKNNHSYYLVLGQMKGFGDEQNYGIVQSVLREILEKQQAGSCLAATKEYVVLLYSLENRSLEQQTEQISVYLRHLMLAMQNYFNIAVKFASSPPFTDLREFTQQWENLSIGSKQEAVLTLNEKQVSSEKIFAVTQYVREHLAENITLASAAEFVHFSPGYLSTLFKQELNVSFSSFVLNLRIKKAKILLLQSDDTLYSIAEQTGFHDASYLVKVFKRVTGLTPNEFRQQYSTKGEIRI